MTPNYVFPVLSYRVIDADTLEAFLDVGFETSRRVRLRFRGIFAPESGTTDGDSATVRMAQLLASAKQITVQTTRPKMPQSFARYVADVYLDDVPLAQRWHIDMNEPQAGIGT